MTHGQPFETLGAGDFLGEVALRYDWRPEATVTAQTALVDPLDAVELGGREPQEVRQV
jgi:hypothetical protein